MLHLIFSSPFEMAVLARLGVNDDVVFLENAVLRLLQHSDLHHVLTPLLISRRFYVLADDLKVRGITVDELIKGIAVIDYETLVALSIKNTLIQSWT